MWVSIPVLSIGSYRPFGSTFFCLSQIKVAPCPRLIIAVVDLSSEIALLQVQRERLTSMQTIMRGMWARMSLRLDALEMRSVSFVIKLSQPETRQRHIAPSIVQSLASGLFYKSLAQWHWKLETSAQANDKPRGSCKTDHFDWQACDWKEAKSPQKQWRCFIDEIMYNVIVEAGKDNWRSSQSSRGPVLSDRWQLAAVS